MGHRALSGGLSYPAHMLAVLFLLQQLGRHQTPDRMRDLTIQNTRSVLLVILDDVALPDLLEAPTPVLDALALQGTTYTRAYANGVCSPTRRSLQTGRYWDGPSTTDCGAYDPSRDAPVGQTFLPALRPETPAALFGKWHLGGSPSGAAWSYAAQERGYDAWRAGMGFNVTSCGGSSYTLWRRCDDGIDQGLVTEYEPTATVEELTAWWDVIQGPRLAVWAPQLAHAPFHRPPENLIPGQPFALTTRGKYLAMIQAFDSLLAEVIAHVDLSEDLVIVIGDNGTPDGVAPAGFRGKAKTTTYRLGTHVPLFLFGMGQKTGAVKGDLVHAVDVYATVAEVFSTPPGDVDGASLLSGQGHAYIVTTGADDVGVRSLSAFLRHTDAGDELYDTDADPDETINLIADPAYDAIEAGLRLELDEFLAR